MFRKKITLSIFSALTAVTLLALPVMAQVPSSAGTAALPNKGQVQQAKLTEKATNLKTRGDTGIDRRVAKLTELTTRITLLKKISNDQKNTFTTGIRTEIATLTSLKAKIDADTDEPTLKIDVQSIVVSYRVFVVYMPQIEMIAAADRILTATDSMSSIAAKLQTRIGQVPAASTTINLQTTLTDMNAKIADAKTQAQSVIAAVSLLTPASYPGSTATLQTNRSLLQTARADLVAAAKDAKTIIQGLQALSATSTLPTSSTMTATGTATNVPVVQTTIAPTTTTQY